VQTIVVTPGVLSADHLLTLPLIQINLLRRVHAA